MQNREIKTNNRFMLLEYVLCAVIIFCNMALRPQIVSSAFTVSFITLTAFFFSRTNIKEQFHLYGTMFGILIVSFLCVLINSFSDNANFSFNGMKNYFMFCSTIIFMFLMLNIKTNKETAERILVINLFIAALYPIGNRFLPQEEIERLTVGITLNFANPNLTAMWILQSLLYLSLAFLILKSKFLKVVAAVIFIMDLELLQQTNARNSIIALFLFAVICVLIVIKQNPHFSKWLIAIVNILPTVFLFTYLKFIGPISQSGKFDFLINEGKELTSRVEIWEKNLAKIENCWLIGSYYGAAGNTHNAHLVILGSFGAITLLLTLYFIFKLCCLTNKQCKTKKNLYCLAAFFAVIFMGIGEGALFSGAMGIYIMACGYIYLARCSFEKSEN